MWGEYPLREAGHLQVLGRTCDGDAHGGIADEIVPILLSVDYEVVKIDMHPEGGPEVGEPKDAGLEAHGDSIIEEAIQLLHSAVGIPEGLYLGTDAQAVRGFLEYPALEGAECCEGEVHELQIREVNKKKAGPGAENERLGEVHAPVSHEASRDSRLAMSELFVSEVHTHGSADPFTLEGE